MKIPSELISNFETNKTQGFKDMYRLIIAITIFIEIFSTCLSAQQRDIVYYLEALKSNHPVIHDFENQARLTELDNMKIKAEYRLPSVFATANLMKAPVINGVGYDEAISNGALYSTLINIEQPILNPSFKMEIELNNIKANKFRFQGQLSAREMEKEATNQYISCFTVQQHLSSARELRKFLGEQYNTSITLAKSGIIKASDILLLEIELGNEDMNITDLQLQFSKEITVLNSLCGLPDTLEAKLSPLDIQIIRNDSTGSNYDYQFTVDSLMAENSLKISGQKYKPQLSAYANLGINAIDPSNIYANRGFSAGIDLKINLFDGHQQKINRQQTQLELESIDNFKRYFTVQRIQSRQNLLNQIGSLRVEMKFAEDQLGKYKTLIAIYHQGLANGDISVLDYLTVLHTYQKTNDAYFNFYQQIQDALNEYNYWNW